MQPSSSLLIPFTFAQLSEQLSDQALVIEASFSQTQPCTIKCWSSSLDDTSQEYVLVGSLDGTLYLFASSQSYPPVGTPIPPSRSVTPSHSPRPPQPQSRSSLASITSPLPLVTPRSRIVSGITTEQVEAPKNYVEFDEETNKLKGMLKGRHPREGKERQATSDDRKDNASSPAPSLPSSLLLHPIIQRKNGSRSLGSTVESPSFRSTSPASTSCPAISVSSGMHDAFDLRCHIIPSRSCPRGAVTSIHLLDENDLVAVLQEMG